jgi:hypothetical protein
MQAVISRTGRVGGTPLVALALVAGLTLGGVSGYSINSLLRTSFTTPGAAHVLPAGQAVPDAVDRHFDNVQTNSSSTDFAISAARHAATERAEAGDPLGTELALSAARHAASERAEAGAVSP